MMATRKSASGRMSPAGSMCQLTAEATMWSLAIVHVKRHPELDQGNRISELRHEPDQVGLIPAGSFELAAQGAF